MTLRRHLATFLVVCAVAATASCGTDEPTDEPDLGGTDAPSASGAADASDGGSDGAGGDVPQPLADPPRKGDRVPEGFSVRAGRLPDGAPERRLAEVLVAYQDARGASYNTASYVPALAGLATGQALTDVQGRAAELDQQGLHTVGDLIAHVDGVEIDGKQATLEGCFDNASVDVNERNIAVESPASAYAVTATAIEVARDAWLIATIVYEPTDSC